LAIAFFVSWALHAIGGAKAFNDDQVQHGQAAISVWRYATTSQFWFESMQNWQSEFIAVAAIVGLSIFLRQRGCAESKPAPRRTDAPARDESVADHPLEIGRRDLAQVPASVSFSHTANAHAARDARRVAIGCEMDS
jgi:hypothetical protein